MSTGYPIIESIVSTIKCARWRGMEADNQADEPKGAAKPEDKDPLDEIIERINEKYKGNFAFVPMVIIGVLLDMIVFKTTSSYCGILLSVLGLGFYLLSFVMSILILTNEKKAQERAYEIMKEKGLATGANIKQPIKFR